jgi:inner membrane protein
VDNITHTFVGAALSECALPRDAAPGARRVLMALGAVAANAPDIDLIYTGLTEAPLGYLLHHRGHSHTLPGLVVLGLLIAGVLRLWPGARNGLEAAGGRRVAALVSAALGSHPLLDAANSYGTLLWYPLSNRWHYGDAVFVLEPSLWVLLGVPVALNARRRWSRALAWIVTVAPPLAFVAVGLVTPPVFAALAVGGAGLVVLLRRRPARARAALVLSVTAALFIGMAGVSAVARAEARERLLAADAGPLVDIVLNPAPATPWCWSVLSIERDNAEDGLLVRRGTLSLLPRIWPASTCVTHRLLADSGFADALDAALVWNREWQVDLTQLRSLHATDCRIRAWLQFGRAPFIADGRIVDLRFDNPLSSNFSAMAFAAAGAPAGCPPNLTNWDAPRSDVLRNSR